MSTATTVTDGSSSFQSLRSYLYVQIGHAGKVAARSAQAGNKANLDRVDRYPKTMGIVAVAAFAATADGVPPAATITATRR